MENIKRIKISKMIELLRHETDALHPMRSDVLCEKMNEQGFSCNTLTLYRDIQAIKDCNINIKEKFIGHTKAFYIEDNTFILPEIRILIDAVLSASFITPKKTDELISKIAALTGKENGKDLFKSVTRFNIKKHTNESIYLIVDSLSNAIDKKKKVSFFYFDLDENGQRVYRRSHKKYIIDPISLVYVDDNYYLLGYNEKYDNTASYRLDRMETVFLTEEDISKGATEFLEKVKIGEYISEVFKMYSGQKSTVTLKFDDKLIGTIYDQFGEDTKIKRLDEKTCSANVTIMESPMFFGWLSSFGKRMTIISPPRMVKEYKKHINEILETFKET